eukprot:693093-Prymnesium_polylepis.1
MARPMATRESKPCVASLDLPAEALRDLQALAASGGGMRELTARLQALGVLKMGKRLQIANWLLEERSSPPRSAPT